MAGLPLSRSQPMLAFLNGWQPEPERMGPVMSAVMEAAGDLQAPELELAVGPTDQPLLFGAGPGLALGAFRAQVRALAARLPEAGHVVHLAEDRRGFLLGFCAAALRGQVALLPPSGAPGTVAEILATHGGDGYRLDPALLARLEDGLDPDPAQSREPLRFRLPALAAVGYTSGSTGRSQAHAKTWRAFATGARQNLLALQDLWGTRQAQVLATVPPQHMYGMELSVLLPLLAGAAVFDGRPLLPADVAQALEYASGARILVTTPVHLRALLRSGVPLPPLAGIVSATAPLGQELAAEAEDRYGTEVREMFGATETCIIARRRTARETLWTPLAGVRLQAQPDGALVHAPHLPVPMPLADLVEVAEDGRFQLCGRQADMLEIAGKRASLGDLTRRLLAVPGVEDAVVVQLPESGQGDGVARLAALVVAPELELAQVLAALRGVIDPVFLPRPLRRVPVLPRNETGKLRRQDVLDLLAAHSSTGTAAGRDAS
jgi:acyl-coenzyme A synthetase/AMP-(fatty) acid ligase